MRRVYMVVVAAGKWNYLLYAPQSRAPQASSSLSGTTAIEAHLRRNGLEVEHRGAIRMENGFVIECFFTRQQVGGKAWKTPLEIANTAPEGDARVFLAALGIVTHENR